MTESPIQQSPRSLVADIVSAPHWEYLPRVGAWAAANPAFYTFLQSYRDKIRKKFVDAQSDPGQAEDKLKEVYAELLAAALLLQDSRFDLDYEPSPQGQVGPDFRATFIDSGARFGLEVTHLRVSDDEPPLNSRLGWSPTGGEWKFVDCVIGKARQLRIESSNVLFISCESAKYEDHDLIEAMTILTDQTTQRYRSMESQFFIKHHISGLADELKEKAKKVRERQRENLSEKLCKTKLSSSDLADARRKLSAVVLSGGWQHYCHNFVWVNEQSQRLPETVLAFLRQMDVGA